MILRVWALYGRSRIILGTLLMLYTIEVIAYLVYSVVVTVNSSSGMWNNTSYHVHYITESSFSQSSSEYWPSAQLFVLRIHIRLPHLGWGCGYFPDCSRVIDVSTCRSSVHQGVTSDVQSNKAIPTKPLHDAPWKGGNDLLSCVRARRSHPFHLNLIRI